MPVISILYDIYNSFMYRKLVFWDMIAHQMTTADNATQKMMINKQMIIELVSTYRDTGMITSFQLSSSF